jgi:hypothetical protein
MAPHDSAARIQNLCWPKTSIRSKTHHAEWITLLGYWEQPANPRMDGISQPGQILLALVEVPYLL